MKLLLVLVLTAAAPLAAQAPAAAAPPAAACAACRRCAACQPDRVERESALRTAVEVHRRCR